MDAEQLFREHLQVIDHIAQSICRRSGVREHEAEDFASDMRLKLCENDFAVIRKFQGKSSFTTYLTVVISKGFLDHRRRIWGKWTPSSKAKRLGPTALLLEKLVYRDGCTFDAACQILEQKHGVTVSRKELRSILAQLPRRAQRRFEGDGELDTLPADDRADASVLDTEHEKRLAAAEQALTRAIQELTEEDRAIIRMLYYEGMSVAELARGLHLEQMRLYPRVRQLLATLRKSLTSQGISPDLLVDVDSS
jgi:RNA polymerase sigma factor for flagellar operon FliA